MNIVGYRRKRRQIIKGKYKAIPEQANYRPRGLQEVEALIFPDNRHMMVVKLSVLNIGLL